MTCLPSAMRLHARAMALIAVIATIVACACSAYHQASAQEVWQSSGAVAGTPLPEHIPGGESFSGLPSSAPSGAVERRRSGSRIAGGPLDGPVAATESPDALDGPGPSVALREQADELAPHVRRRTAASPRAPPLRAGM